MALQFICISWIFIRIATININFSHACLQYVSIEVEVQYFSYSLYSSYPIPVTFLQAFHVPSVKLIDSFSLIIVVTYICTYICLCAQIYKYNLIRLIFVACMYVVSRLINLQSIANTRAHDRERLVILPAVINCL